MLYVYTGSCYTQPIMHGIYNRTVWKPMTTRNTTNVYSYAYRYTDIVFRRLTILQPIYCDPTDVLLHTQISICHSIMLGA